MRDRKTGWLQGIRFLTALAVLSLLFSTLGCAAKKVRIYDDSSSVTPARDSIIQYATTLLGKPYKNAAKGPDSFDCSGFIYYVYRRFDIGVPNHTEALIRVGREISADDVIAADLVMFRINRENHVGIMINKAEFIHASKSRGIVVDSLEGRYWKRNFSHFRRVIY